MPIRIQTQLKSPMLSPMIKRINSIERWKRIDKFLCKVIPIVFLSAAFFVIGWCIALWRLSL